LRGKTKQKIRSKAGRHDTFKTGEGKKGSLISSTPKEEKTAPWKRERRSEREKGLSPRTKKKKKDES